MFRTMLFRARPASGLLAAIILVTATLSIAAGAALAETADERDLRAHAAGDNLPAVQTLLARGASPNVPDHDGRTAVHHAAAIAKAPILEALLEAGGDPNVQDAVGATPLHLAADFPYFEPDSRLSVRVLLAFGADPGVTDNAGRTPLHAAAGNHDGAAAVRDLLAHGADANAVDRQGDTPLHHAIDHSGKFSADVVAALVDGGARGNAVGSSGETPLQLFARIGTDDGLIVDALVAAGADPDAENPDGETPLHATIRGGGSTENPEVVEALLAAGADPCITDASGYLPYNTAREGGRVHAMLANAGGSDRACDGGGRSGEVALTEAEIAEAYEEYQAAEDRYFDAASNAEFPGRMKYLKEVNLAMYGVEMLMPVDALLICEEQGGSADSCWAKREEWRAMRREVVRELEREVAAARQLLDAAEERYLRLLREAN